VAAAGYTVEKLRERVDADISCLKKCVHQQKEGSVVRAKEEGDVEDEWTDIDDDVFEDDKEALKVRLIESITYGFLYYFP